MRLTGERLTIEEIELIRDMSSEYVKGSHEFKEKGSLPPYVTEVTVQKMKADYAEQRKAQLRQISKRNAKKTGNK